MARTLDEILVTQLGQLTYKLAQLGLDNERLREENALLKASHPLPPPTEPKS